MSLILKFEKLSNNRWRLLEDLFFDTSSAVFFKTSRQDISFDHVKIPAGFITDFASIPKPLKLIYKYDTIYSKASILHDYLYQKGLFDRKVADGLFYKAMRSEGVGWFKSKSIYRAVRMFGWVFYKKNES